MEANYKARALIKALETDNHQKVAISIAGYQCLPCSGCLLQWALVCFFVACSWWPCASSACPCAILWWCAALWWSPAWWALWASWWWWAAASWCFAAWEWWSCFMLRFPHVRRLIDRFVTVFPPIRYIKEDGLTSLPSVSKPLWSSLNRKQNAGNICTH